ncbi:MAG: AAA family ATPase [Gammaproteobacteria bacterium]|nr:AAA family ATPase [Gammaproteobacteria bacterium]
MSDFPYPGLRPFARDETDIFFGREEQTDELIARLADTHFLAVIGPSGCGKSSLVRTGLLADLETGFLADAGAQWCVAELRPGNHPFARLARALLADTALGQTYLPQLRERAQAEAFLQAKLRRIASKVQGGVQALLAEAPLPADTNLLILVDQFEEIFRYYRQRDAEEAEMFVAMLLATSQAAVTESGCRIYIVITMRSDFLGDCALFHGLPETVNEGLFLTPRMTREQLRDAITAPARVFGKNIESGLVNHLLNEMGDNPDRLPVLQHLLMRIWHKTAGAAVLTMEQYKAAGGLENALSLHADEAYAELSPAQRKIAEMLFRALSERGSEHRDTRRPAILQSVAAQAEAPWEEVAAVAEIFRQSGRSFLTPPPLEVSSHQDPSVFSQKGAEKILGEDLTLDTVLDISHESLIRQWRRLKKWADTEAESGDLYRRMEETACRWHDKKAALWRSPELEIALVWREKTQPAASWASRYGKHYELAMRFLDASEAQQRKERRLAEEIRQRQHELQRIRWQVIFALLGLTITAGLASWGYMERGRAMQSEQQAQASEQRVEQAALGLVESQLSYAALLLKGEDYFQARQVLRKTRELDEKIPTPRRNTRDLLAWFSELRGGGPRQVYRKTGTGLSALALSPDGRLLAAAGEEGVLLFDAHSGERLQHLPGDGSPVNSLVFHPQGKWLAGAGKNILFWSPSFLAASRPPLPDGQPQWQQTNRWFGRASALALSPDGTRLATGGYDSNITLWDTETGKPMHSFSGHTQQIIRLSFSASGKLLASASYDDTARLWKINSGDSLHIFKHTGNVRSLSFSPDGKRLATGGDDKNIRLWNVATGRIIRRLQGHRAKISALRFAADGRYLASGGYDRILRLWDTERGVTVRVLQGHREEVTAIHSLVSQSEEDFSLFSAGADGMLIRWEWTLPWQKTADLPGEPSVAAIAPDGKSVAAGFADGALRLYSLPDARLLETREEAHDDRIRRLTFSPAGDLLASSDNETAKLWRINLSEKERKGPWIESEAQSEMEGVHTVLFAPDGLAAADYEGQITLFTIIGASRDAHPANTGTEGTRHKRTFQAHEGFITSLAFDAKGTRLLSSGDGRMSLWDISGDLSAPLQDFPEAQQVIAAALSPDGERAIGVEADGTVRIYASRDGRMQQQIEGGQKVFRAIFSKDGQRIATINKDAVMRVWDLNDNKELFTLSFSANNIFPAVLSDWDFSIRCLPSGCRLAVPLIRDKLLLYETNGTYTKSLP